MVGVGVACVAVVAGEDAIDMSSKGQTWEAIPKFGERGIDVTYNDLGETQRMVERSGTSGKEGERYVRPWRQRRFQRAGRVSHDWIKRARKIGGFGGCKFGMREKGGGKWSEENEFKQLAHLPCVWDPYDHMSCPALRCHPALA
jgi:hypothetical protein